MTVDEAFQHGEEIRRCVNELNSALAKAANEGMFVQLSIAEYSDLTTKEHPMVVIDTLSVHVGRLR